LRNLETICIGMCSMKHDERDSAAGWTKSGSRDAGGDAARGSAACSGRGDAGCSSLEFGNVPEQCGPLDEDVSREGGGRSGEPQGNGKAAQLDEEAASAIVPLDRREEPTAVP